MCTPSPGHRQKPMRIWGTGLILIKVLLVLRFGGFCPGLFKLLVTVEAKKLGYRPRGCRSKGVTESTRSKSG